jgi:hypothetical protein
MENPFGQVNVSTRDLGCCAGPSKPQKLLKKGAVFLQVQLQKTPLDSYY